jgi:hypothetical protein
MLTRKIEGTEDRTFDEPNLESCGENASFISVFVYPQTILNYETVGHWYLLNYRAGFYTQSSIAKFM